VSEPPPSAPAQGSTTPVPPGEPASSSPSPSPGELRRRLGEVSLRDERRLRRQVDRAAGTRDPGVRATALATVADEIHRAEQALARRRAAVPAITYPPGLPITSRTDDVLAALRDHQVVVVAGETGSGKSTQLPKVCLELGRGVRGAIAHTQPRRLAARAVAERVAEELDVELGGAVGYKVRFTDRIGDDTLVAVVTDGTLLAEIQRDPLLLRYDTVIVDEAHERSLNIDFLLGYLRQLLPRRRDLKLIITSATIDTARFAAHFDGAPVIEVSGRSYPVEVRYRPYGIEPDDDRDQVQAICDAVEELGRVDGGDVLVFLSGEREIRDTADALTRLQLRSTEILPLYARLSAAEQHRIFQPHPGRRVVLATNVAETSLTVPGIRSVVDAGTARISRYSRRLKVQRLPIEPISQASANQRAGRCGRVAPGTCIRLYAEDDLVERPEFTEPEILRTNLAAVILQMAVLGLGDVAAFPFVDPPDARSVQDGLNLLVELGALTPGDGDVSQRLTKIGRQLARLPLDPRLGRMVLEAVTNGCVREVMVIAASLSIQDPRERPTEHRQAAEELHRRFADPRSDALSTLRLWDHLREQQSALSSNQFRRMCKAEYLHHLRVREWRDLFSQLRQVGADLGIHVQSEPAEPDAIHRSLLAGLLSHVGMREGEAREYRGARGGRFVLARGSVLEKKPPRWVVVAELVETNRLWGRVASPIQPEWAERLGAHLVARSYGEPRWDARKATAMTTERVTLYGLPVVAARSVPYQRVDPAAARELFVRHALVEGEWPGAPPVVAANRALFDDVRALEDRARRRDLLRDDGLTDFYEARVGADVTSPGHFDRWWKRARAADPDALTARLADVLRPDAPAVDEDSYPEVWWQGDVVLAVSYAWEPGAPDDGVTIHVPLSVLHRIDDVDFDWHVPGAREELVTALIRALPKPLRRHVIPASDHAEAFLATATPADGPLAEVLAAALRRTAGEAIAADDFELDRVPDHLRIRFSVEDDDGMAVATGRDLGTLQQRLRGQVRAAVARAAGDLERRGLTDWTIGELPRVVTVRRGAHVVEGFPALVDEGETVGVRVFSDPLEQELEMAAGTRRLLLLTLPSPRKAIERLMTNESRLALARTGYGTVADLVDDCTTGAVDHLLATAGGAVWDADAFGRLRDAVKAELPTEAGRIGTTAVAVLVAAGRVEGQLAGLTSPGLAPSVSDMRTQLAALVHPGFVATAGAARLADLVRYVRAVERRLETLTLDPVRDRRRMAPLRELEDEFDALLARLPPGEFPPEAGSVRWLLEELRVSVFAQQLGTAPGVSERRIRQELARLARG
jgi:ATP-dependent helicase HrpA